MTATFEACTIADQTVLNFQGLRRDMRQNATDYPARIAAGQSVSDVAAIMQADAAAYLVRLGWAEAITNDPSKLAILTSGLQAKNLDPAEATSVYSELLAAATAQANAAVTSADDVTAASTTLLASVAPNLSLW